MVFYHYLMYHRTGNGGISLNNNFEIVFVTMLELLEKMNIEQVCVLSTSLQVPPKMHRSNGEAVICFNGTSLSIYPMGRKTACFFAVSCALCCMEHASASIGILLTLIPVYFDDAIALFNVTISILFVKLYIVYYVLPCSWVFFVIFFR